MNILEKLMVEIKADAKGSLILHDWLGAGGAAVAQEQAEGRAQTCAECLQNVPGRWWEHAFKNKIADAIKEQIEIRNKLVLFTDHDSRLGTCGICSCNLPLKVFVPIHHIQAHTSTAELLKFPDHCWIKKEITV
jgi:hypothetical protein